MYSAEKFNSPNFAFRGEISRRFRREFMYSGKKKIHEISRFRVKFRGDFTAKIRGEIALKNNESDLPVTKVDH